MSFLLVIQKGDKMEYNTATMIYGFAGFRRMENKLMPNL